LENQLQKRLKANIAFEDLSNQKAVYSGMFTVTGSSDIGTLQYEVQYQEDKNGYADCLSKKWSRTTLSGDLHQLLDVSLVNLES